MQGNIRLYAFDDFWVHLRDESPRLLPDYWPLSAGERVMDAVEDVVLLWDAGSERLVPANPTGYPDSEAMLAVRFPSGSTLPGRVFAGGDAKSQHVELGDAIFVPTEIKKDKDWWKIVTGSMALITGMATTALLVAKL